MGTCRTAHAPADVASAGVEITIAPWVFQASERLVSGVLRECPTGGAEGMNIGLSACRRFPLGSRYDESKHDDDLL